MKNYDSYGQPGQERLNKYAKKHLIWIIPLAALIVLTIGFLIYASFYFHADQTALNALHSDEIVKISKTEYGWFFDGPSEENVYIFYPGAKVEETAYAPLLHQLAENDMDVCLVKMPLRFAFFGIDKAGPIIQRNEYDHYYMGGHSLGGAMAAIYAADHSDGIAGIIHLASYSTKELDDSMMEIVIYGTEDKIVSRESIEEGRKLAPDQYYEYTIEGGNHAWFGNYGIQPGDGTASISAQKQQSEAIRLILDTIGN